MQQRHGYMLIGLALVATSCGGEQIAERIAENRIEAEGGGDVDIDLDGGNFSVKTEDGEFSIKTDDDGNVSIQGGGENGDESFTIDSENGETVVESDGGTAVFTQGGDLPDGFPSDIPVPSDMAIIYAQAANSEDGQAFSIAGSSSMSLDDVIADTQAGLESAGYDEMQVTTTPDGALLTYRGDTHDVMVVIGTGGDSETSVTMNVTPTDG